MASTTLRKKLDSTPISSNQGLLLCSAPALNLPFCSDGICNAVEMLRPNETDGSARRRVSGSRTGLMLGDATVQIIASRAADVERTVGTSEHVDKATHGPTLPSSVTCVILRCSAQSAEPRRTIKESQAFASSFEARFARASG